MDATTISKQLAANAPAEWSLSTETDGHIALIHQSGRSIGLNKHTAGWTVMGVAGYGDEDYPRFATNGTGGEAIEAALNAMQAVVDGDPEAAPIVARSSKEDLTTDSAQKETSESERATTESESTEEPEASQPSLDDYL
jgi:hypothetical protein